MQEKQSVDETATHKAMRYGNAVAMRILQEEPRLAEKIAVLYRERQLTSEQIGVLLNGSMQIPDDVKDATRGAIVRRVLRELIPDAERQKIANALYRRNLAANADCTSSGRNEWMQRNGMVVWNQEEDAYFWELTENTDMHRPMKKNSYTTPRMNHVKIAAAMNTRFNTSVFTAKICQERYAVHRYMRRKREAESDTSKD